MDNATGAQREFHADQFNKRLMHEAEELEDAVGNDVQGTALDAGPAACCGRV